MSFMSGILMRMARAVLGNVLSQLTQQLNGVKDQALSPMRAIIQQMTSGVWIGEGANVFVEEVSSLMIPGVGKVGEHISTMSSNLQSARDILDQADEAADRLIQGNLSDAFKFY
jgi:hypothetical protein